MDDSHLSATVTQAQAQGQDQPQLFATTCRLLKKGLSDRVAHVFLMGSQEGKGRRKDEWMDGWMMEG